MGETQLLDVHTKSSFPQFSAGRKSWRNGKTMYYSFYSTITEHLHHSKTIYIIYLRRSHNTSWWVKTKNFQNTRKKLNIIEIPSPAENYSPKTATNSAEDTERKHFVRFSERPGCRVVSDVWFQLIRTKLLQLVSTLLLCIINYKSILQHKTRLFNETSKLGLMETVKVKKTTIYEHWSAKHYFEQILISEKYFLLKPHKKKKNSYYHTPKSRPSFISDYEVMHLLFW